MIYDEQFWVCSLDFYLSDFICYWESFIKKKRNNNELRWIITGYALQILICHIFFDLENLLLMRFRGRIPSHILTHHLFSDYWVACSSNITNSQWKIFIFWSITPSTFIISMYFYESMFLRTYCCLVEWFESFDQNYVKMASNRLPTQRS